jgi:hypothetical protein
LPNDLANASADLRQGRVRRERTQAHKMNITSNIDIISTFEAERLDTVLWALSGLFDDETRNGGR